MDKKSPQSKPPASALGFYKDWVPVWITGQCDCQHTTKKTSLPTRTSSQFVHFSWEWNLPSPPVCWLRGGARPSWPGALDVGASSGGARENGTDCQLWCLHLSQQEVESRTSWQQPTSSHHSVSIPRVPGAPLKHRKVTWFCWWHFQPASSGDHDLVHCERNTSIKLLPVSPFLFTDWSRTLKIWCTLSPEHLQISPA